MKRAPQRNAFVLVVAPDFFSRGEEAFQEEQDPFPGDRTRNFGGKMMYFFESPGVWCLICPVVWIEEVPAARNYNLCIWFESFRRASTRRRMIFLHYSAEIKMMLAEKHIIANELDKNGKLAGSPIKRRGGESWSNKGKIVLFTGHEVIADSIAIRWFLSRCTDVYLHCYGNGLERLYFGYRDRKKSELMPTGVNTSVVGWLQNANHDV